MSTAPQIQQLIQAMPPATLQRTRETLLNPLLFSRKFLGVDLWPRQQEILTSVFSNRRTAVRACHSSGKTFVASVVVLAFLARFTEVICITTAPTYNQVVKLLWTEIRSLVKTSRARYPWPEMPPVDPLLRIADKRYAYGLSTNVEKNDEGVRFQGTHAKNILIVMDEAVGVDPKIQEAAEGMMASGSAHLLAIGNPTVNSGPFYDAFHKDRARWACFTISAFDTPNLAGCSIEQLQAMAETDPAALEQAQRPYLINRTWVLEQFKKWGLDHPFYQSRVLGEFPKQDEYSLISLSWTEAAKNSTLEPQPGTKVRGGLDVAGPGASETSLTLRRGPRIILQDATAQPDPRGWVVSRLEPFLTNKDLENINVDTVGIGYGMFLHLQDLGFPVTAVNVGDAPLSKDKEKFANLKAELYWATRQALQQGAVSGLTDDTTAGQLVSIKWETTPQGKIAIESKESMAKRGVPSPDRAESTMLAFAMVNDVSVWARL